MHLGRVDRCLHGGIVASHPDNPIPKLQAFWEELTVFHSSLLPPDAEKYLAYFGNRAFYSPRLDYVGMPFWTNFYELRPIKKTLERYVSFETIARSDVKLVVTATDVKSGAIAEFRNDDPDDPLTMNHLIASGSLPPSYPAQQIGDRMYWDGGLFDNTPLSSLLGLIEAGDAAATRVHRRQPVPEGGSDPQDHARRLGPDDRAAVCQQDREGCRGRAQDQQARCGDRRTAGHPDGRSEIRAQPAPSSPTLAKYRVFENIIAISNDEPEPVSSSADFSYGEHRAPDRGRLPRRQSGADASAEAGRPLQASRIRKSPEDHTCPSR